MNKVNVRNTDSSVSEPSPRRTFAGRSNAVDTFSYLWLIGGVLSSVAPLVYLILSIVRSGGRVAVAVALSPEQLARVDDGRVPIGASVPDGTYMEYFSGGLTLKASDPTLVEQFLSYVGTPLTVAAFLITVALFWRVMRSIALGAPFDPANARRLLICGLVVPVATMVGLFAEFLASYLVLARLGLDGLGSPIVVGVPLYDAGGTVWPLLLLPFAAAFRWGAQLSDDVEGLV